MAPTKKQTAKKKMKEAVKKSVARSEARAKQPTPKTGSGDALLVAMGKASLNLARVQDEITRLQKIHEASQREVQSIRQQLEKRGDGK